jgi:uncharacterized UBP type Zn finger protein
LNKHQKVNWTEIMNTTTIQKLGCLHCKKVHTVDSEAGEKYLTLHPGNIKGKLTVQELVEAFFSDEELEGWICPR